jgi:hypothetical protein
MCSFLLLLSFFLSSFSPFNELASILDGFVSLSAYKEATRVISAFGENFITTIKSHNEMNCSHIFMNIIKVYMGIGQLDLSYQIGQIALQVASSNRAVCVDDFIRIAIVVAQVCLFLLNSFLF